MKLRDVVKTIVGWTIEERRGAHHQQQKLCDRRERLQPNGIWIVSCVSRRVIKILLLDTLACTIINCNKNTN